MAAETKLNPTSKTETETTTQYSLPSWFWPGQVRHQTLALLPLSARVAGSEDQRVGRPGCVPPPGQGQPHTPEVDLALISRVAVGHPHRDALPPASTANLQDVTLNRSSGPPPPLGGSADR